jgi:prepilin signal peptidase PulO-like enzyme (type II secretory pathway)
VDPEDFGESEPIGEEPLNAAAAERPRPPLKPATRIAGWLAGGLLLALLVGLFIENTKTLEFVHAPRAFIPLIFLFVLIVSESAVVRTSDQQIVDALDEERHTARRMVLAEFVVLLPAILFGFVGLWLMTGWDELAGRAHDALHSGTRVWGVSMMRSWAPLQGLATAATGYVVAGAIGWTVRIVFTLVFGKEAFGTGDIHLMAATGCVAGWPVVLLGFFLTCGLALLGWVLALPFKRARALPLGPWLSLSFLAVVIFYDSIIRWAPVARTILSMRMLFFDNSQIGPVEVHP